MITRPFVENCTQRSGVLRRKLYAKKQALRKNRMGRPSLRSHHFPLCMQQHGICSFTNFCATSRPLSIHPNSMQLRHFDQPHATACFATSSSHLLHLPVRLLIRRCEQPCTASDHSLSLQNVTRQTHSVALLRATWSAQRHLSSRCLSSQNFTPNSDAKFLARRVALCTQLTQSSSGPLRTSTIERSILF